jgi:hypothetical protein
MGKAKPALNGEAQFSALNLNEERLHWRLVPTAAFNGESTVGKARALSGRRGFSNRIFSGYRMLRMDEVLSMAANGYDGSGPASRSAVDLSAALREPPIEPVMLSCGPLHSRQSGEISLTEFSRRTSANMEVVLDEVFEGVPHGGDHESRKYVAERLIQSARKGNVTLDGLRTIGRNAFRQLSTRRLADAVSVIRESALPDQPAKR